MTKNHIFFEPQRKQSKTQGTQRKFLNHKGMKEIYEHKEICELGETICVLCGKTIF